MADPKKEYKNRTFVKKGLNGERLERVVTNPASEVAATFEGYIEEKSTKSSSGGSASAGSGGGSPKSSSSS